MFKQNMLNITPLVVACGLALGGCANQQAWSPALEDAQNTYQQVSQDPIVASLAAAELQSARRQLTAAETAADEFRKPHSINHEAKLAKIKTLVAQQRARALSANHSLQLALGQSPLLPEEQLLAATTIETYEEPVMAAANTGSEQDIHGQIAALSEQLAALQAQIGLSPVEIPGSQQSLAVLELNSLHTGDAMVDEPLIGAAMSEQSMDMLKPLPSPSQIKQQLSAINAKPTSQGMSLTLGERYFDQGTARLWNGRAARHLDNVASVLNNNPELILDIEAHTDNTAQPDTSYDLSTGRAVSIKTALVLRGINESRINAKGFGHTRPIAANADLMGRLQNRRVELIFPNVQL